MKLMHGTRRGPGEFILVNGAKLELDEQGCVEVTVEQAGKLLQGGLWREPEYWARNAPKSVIAPEVTPGSVPGRRVRTKEELAGLAAAEGVVIPEAIPVPAEAEAPRAEEAPQAEQKRNKRK